MFLSDGKNDYYDLNADNPDAGLVPDLSNLSEEEFRWRLKNLRKSHQELLELCDHVGIKERSIGRAAEKIQIKKSKLQSGFYSESISVESLSSETSSKYSSKNIAKNKRFIGPNCDYLRPSNSDALLNLKINRFFKGSDESSLNCQLPVKRSRSLTSDSDFRFKVRGTKKPITVCKPFSMTLREEEKKRNNFSTKSSKQLERDLKMKRDMENMELKRTFEALPLPSSTAEGLYDELLKNNKVRKERNLLKRNEFLMRTSKPFGFVEREKSRVQSGFSERDFSASPKEVFRANPFPVHLFSERTDEKLRRAAILRQIRSAERSEQLLMASRSLSSMKYRSIKHKCHAPVQADKKRNHILRCDVPRLSRTLGTPPANCTGKASDAEPNGCADESLGVKYSTRILQTSCRELLNRNEKNDRRKVYPRFIRFMFKRELIFFYI